MRKCVIHTRTVKEDGSLTPSVLLEPFVHKALYNIPSVRKARKFLAENEDVHLICVRVENRSYMVTIITPDNKELENNSFEVDCED